MGSPVSCAGVTLQSAFILLSPHLGAHEISSNADKGVKNVRSCAIDDDVIAVDCILCVIV